MLNLGLNIIFVCVSTKYSAMIVLYCLDVRTYNEHEGNHHKCLPVVSIKCGKTLPGCASE